MGSLCWPVVGPAPKERDNGRLQFGFEMFDVLEVAGRLGRAKGVALYPGHATEKYEIFVC